jgi:hypothetical protein
MSDAREIILGLDPYTSDAAFISAVRENPSFFALHSPEEIHHLHLSSPVIRTEDGSVKTLEFALHERNRDDLWEVREEFSLPIGSGTLPRRFLKLGAR